jgi:hypothetical protein
MEGLLRGILIVCIIAFMAGPSLAESETDIQSRLDVLTQQVKDMSSAMEAQKAEIDALQKKLQETKAAEPAPAAPAAAAPAVKVSSKYNIKLYGKIKFDAIYDTNNMGRDEFITFVPASASGADEVTFNVRDTRFGIAIEGPSACGWQATGRFETDFYGGQPLENNGQMRIRLSYIDLAKGGTSVRVGQDWTQIAALNPNTIDFAVMGYNGNLWARVPQITVRQNFGGGFEGLVTAYRFLSGNDDPELRMPWLGAKMAYTTEFMGPKKAYVALGAAVRDGEVSDNSVTPYLLAFEAKIPVSIVDFSGEAYMGQGLGAEYFHSPGAFNAEGAGILTRGGWIQASANVLPKVQLNAGYGIDDPKNEDVGTTFFKKSRYMFANVQVKLMEDITAGFEAANVRTDWPSGQEHGTRYQTSLIYLW